MSVIFFGPEMIYNDTSFANQLDIETEIMWLLFLGFGALFFGSRLKIPNFFLIGLVRIQKNADPHFLDNWILVVLLRVGSEFFWRLDPYHIDFCIEKIK